MLHPRAVTYIVWYLPDAGSPLCRTLRQGENGGRPREQVDRDSSSVATPGRSGAPRHLLKFLVSNNIEARSVQRPRRRRREEKLRPSTSPLRELLSKRDFYAGGLMMLLGLGIALKGTSYRAATLMHMGPGFLPTALGILL